MSELPEGWTRVVLKDVLTLVNGFPFKPSQWQTDGLPIIRIQNLNNPRASFNYCSDKLPERFRVKYDDLLFAWSGTPGTSFGCHIWSGGDAWLNQHIFRVEFDRGLFDRTFLKHAINQNLDDYIAQAHGGAGLANITKGKFEESVLIMSPLNEQRRIVAKLEELLAKVEACQERLAKIPTLLKRFRQSVLNAACSGRLTTDWRQRNAANESGLDLLERIKEQRLFAAQTAKQKKQILDAFGQERFHATEMESGLDDIPDTWVSCRVGQVGTVCNGATPSRKCAEYWGGCYALG